MALRANQHIKRPRPHLDTFTPFSAMGVEVFFCVSFGGSRGHPRWRAA